MSTPDAGLLDALTLGRLLDMGRLFEQRIAVIQETETMLGASPENTRIRMGADLALYADAAALCRAVANAEGVPGWSVNTLGVGAGYGVSTVYGYGDMLTRPTLAAALASVATTTPEVL